MGLIDCVRVSFGSVLDGRSCIVQFGPKLVGLKELLELPTLYFVAWECGFGVIKFLRVTVDCRLHSFSLESFLFLFFSTLFSFFSIFYF